MAECIARLEETASQTLKDQITATGPYRYRFEGIVHASLHIKTIECSIKNAEYWTQELWYEGLIRTEQKNDRSLIDFDLIA